MLLLPPFFLGSMSVIAGITMGHWEKVILWMLGPLIIVMKELSIMGQARHAIAVFFSCDCCSAAASSALVPRSSGERCLINGPSPLALS